MFQALVFTWRMSDRRPLPSGIAHTFHFTLTTSHGSGGVLTDRRAQFAAGWMIGSFGIVQRSPTFVQDQLVGFDENTVLGFTRKIPDSLNGSIMFTYAKSYFLMSNEMHIKMLRELTRGCI